MDSSSTHKNPKRRCLSEGLSLAIYNHSSKTHMVKVGKNLIFCERLKIKSREDRYYMTSWRK